MLVVEVEEVVEGGSVLRWKVVGGEVGGRWAVGGGVWLTHSLTVCSQALATYSPLFCSSKPQSSMSIKSA